MPIANIGVRKIADAIGTISEDSRPSPVTDTIKSERVKLLNVGCRSAILADFQLHGRVELAVKSNQTIS